MRIIAACALVASFLLSVVAAAEAPSAGTIEAIRRYEDLFDRVHLALRRPQTEGFGLEAKTLDFYYHHTELTLDRANKRTKYVGETKRYTGVLTGAVYREWRPSEAKPSGRFLIAPNQPNHVPEFYKNYLQPHALFGYLDAAAADVLEDDGAFITIRYTFKKNYTDIRYERYGNYMRPVSIQPWYPREAGPLLGTVFAYTYDNTRPTEAERLAPATILRYNETHHMQTYLEIVSVDFAPAIAPEAFMLPIPQGANVVDKINDSF